MDTTTSEPRPQQPPLESSIAILMRDLNACREAFRAAYARGQVAMADGDLARAAECCEELQLRAGRCAGLLRSVMSLQGQKKK